VTQTEQCGGTIAPQAAWPLFWLCSAKRGGVGELQLAKKKRFFLKSLLGFPIPLRNIWPWQGSLLYLGPLLILRLPQIAREKAKSSYTA
jgi:hypothetical protein